MSKLYFTVACPRAGKSSYATKWASEAPMRAIVCSDNIRLAMHGQRYAALAETMVFATKHIMIRALLDRGFDVIVDGTHTSEISIQRILEIQIDAQPIPFFTASKQVCIDRAIACQQFDVIPAIERTYKNLLKLCDGIHYEKDIKSAHLALKASIDKIALKVLERQNNVIVG